MCSMISAQRDELRWLADNLEEHDSHMDEYVQAMRSAADTIWELRNKMSDMVDARERARVLEADNAKLREERDEWHRVAVSKQDIIDHMRDARGENAKLREYVTAVANDVYGSELFDCSGCRFFDGCYNDAEKEHDGRGCQWFLWARELGIEVNE